ncbi:FadR/GntR family transcriptional regulator [Meridianimarinicoccus sp. MJW13]|uniref:FadR/GntR family transcriptional regulator n=1 Tax=Meridianimarinicoccus sp. MJW13 TaxID=2720031 RepID=UPI0018687BCD|nr:FadR/GntR family transcriptional regulator [Fluviibacterium sp. MJW13]
MENVRALLTPIDHHSVADSVVEQIEDMILAGVLSEGRRLPSERDMAATLGVSRPKLREALKLLEARGLLSVRHGEGSFIAPLTGKAMSDALIELYGRHGTAFFDYLEYRRVQESFAARLAADRATKTDKAIIHLYLEALAQDLERGDSDASRDHDVKFHAAIVAASHNATLIHMMRSIYDLSRQTVFYNRAYLRTIDGSGALLHKQHTAIAEAVCAHDPDRAAQAAEAHIDFVAQSMRIGLDQARREAIAAKRAALLSEDVPTPPDQT